MGFHELKLDIGPIQIHNDTYNTAKTPEGRLKRTPIYSFA